MDRLHGLNCLLFRSSVTHLRQISKSEDIHIRKDLETDCFRATKVVVAWLHVPDIGFRGKVIANVATKGLL